MAVIIVVAMIAAITIPMNLYIYIYMFQGIIELLCSRFPVPWMNLIIRNSFMDLLSKNGNQEIKVTVQ